MSDVAGVIDIGDRDGSDGGFWLRTGTTSVGAASARLETAAAAAVEAGATLAVTEVVAAAPSVTMLLLLVVAVDDARSLAVSFTSREAEAGEPRAF